MTILLAALLVQSGIDWKTDYDAALAEAKKSGRYLHVHVWGPDCHYCEMMERKTFPDAEAIKLSNERFVNVKIGTTTHRKLCEKFEVGPIPVTILVSPDGEKAGEWVGYLGPAEYRASLEGGVKAHATLKDVEPKLKATPDDPALLSAVAAARADLGDARRAGTLYRQAAGKTADAKAKSILLLKAFELWNSLEGEPALNADLAALAGELDAFDAALELKDDAAFVRAMVAINEEKLDDALAKLAALTKTWPKSDRAPHALIMEANLLHHHKEDHPGALARCQAVIDGWPKTEWAENAKSMMEHIKAHSGSK
jgi:hypothetical protein